MTDRSSITNKVLASAAAILILALAVILSIYQPWNQRESSQQPRVGAILDLTGPAASFGAMQQQGMQLALEDIRDSDCAEDLELIVEDSRLDARLALSAVSKLIESDSVIALTSITGSSMALAVAPIANRERVPIVDSLSSSPALTTDGGEYYFRIQPADSYAGTYLVDWAIELGTRSSAIIYSDSDWGQGLRDAIRAMASERGLAIELEDRVRPGDVDFRAMIARLRSSPADTVFLLAHPQEAGLFLRQAGESRLPMRILGSDSLSTQEVKTAAGDFLDGVLFALSSEGSGEMLENFRARFRERFGADANANSIRAYDALMLIHRVVCDTGSNREAIRAALDSLEGYEGVSGPLSFDSNGDVADPAYDRFVYVGGAYRRLSEQ